MDAPGPQQSGFSILSQPGTQIHILFVLRVCIREQMDIQGARASGEGPVEPGGESQY